ncbi:MAG: hypothetical protein V1745_02680 [Patescibacteria group bacterium]
MIAEARLLVAICTSAEVANDPESRSAPVMVRTSDVQTAVAVSATNVPNDVRVRPAPPVNDQIAEGSEANRLDDADETTASVLAFTASVPAVIAEARLLVATVKLSSTTSLIVLVVRIDPSTMKLLSTLTRSPFITLPHVMKEGHTPDVAFAAVK